MFFIALFSSLPSFIAFFFFPFSRLFLFGRLSFCPFLFRAVGSGPSLPRFINNGIDANF